MAVNHTGYFNSKAKGLEGLGMGFDSTASSEPPQSTLFACIAPDLDINVAVQPVSIPVATQEGAYAQACDAQVELSSIGQEVDRNLAAGVKAIQLAQGEIIAATKACGLDAAKMFPDTKMAPDTTLGMMANMLNGKGTLMTSTMKVIDGAALAEDILNGLKDRPVEEIKSSIADALRAQSDPSHKDQNNFKGLIADAGAPPEIPGSSIRWNTVLDEHPEALDEIMYFNPESPNPEAFPELAELAAQKGDIDYRLGDVEFVKENAVDAPKKVAAAKAEIPADPVPALLADMKKESWVTAVCFTTFEELPPAVKVENIPKGLNVSTLPQSFRDMLQAERSGHADAGQTREAELAEFAKKFESSGPSGPTNTSTV